MESFCWASQCHLLIECFKSSFTRRESLGTPLNRKNATRSLPRVITKTYTVRNAKQRSALVTVERLVHRKKK
jgi:hypothetical protein